MEEYKIRGNTIYTYFRCEKCKKMVLGWTVRRKEWLATPKKFQRKPLCKNCFKNLSGIKKPNYLTQKNSLRIFKYAYGWRI